MTVVAPSLSDRGWISNPSEKADQLLAWFFATDAAQSYLYTGNVTDVHDLLQRFGDDILGLCAEMQDRLDRYLTPHFDQVVVDVTSSIADNPSSKVTVSIAIQVVVDGRPYSITSLYGDVNSRFVRITNYINTGVLSGT